METEPKHDDETAQPEDGVSDAVLTGGALGGVCCVAALPSLIGVLLAVVGLGAMWLFDADTSLESRGAYKWAILGGGVALCCAWGAFKLRGTRGRA